VILVINLSLSGTAISDLLSALAGWVIVGWVLLVTETG